MGFASELAEAVEASSIQEQISFLDVLDEHVTTALHTGFFTEEVMEEAWVAILRESDFQEGDEAEVFEAIDEWLDEELALLERDAAKARALARAMGKKATSSVGKEVARQSKKPLIKLGKKAAKRITGIKTKTKTGKMLKHAAAGAVRQIAKNPGSAKKVLKKAAKKAGKKLVKSAVKKGMKMVFGKWLKTEHVEMEALEERKRSSKRAEVERAFAKRGTIKMRPINPREYPPIRGMEGPFQFRSGRILYYDPREGAYYDSKSDMYLGRNEIPEDAQEMLDALQEVDDYGLSELTEAVAVKAWVPIFETAMGVKMDQRQGKLVVNEFMSNFRKYGDWNMWDGEVEIISDKNYEVEGEGEYTPKGRSYGWNDPPGYWDVTYSWKGSFRFPTKAKIYHKKFKLNIPGVVDGMSPLIKRLFGGEAFMNCRKNLARALLSNDRLFKRFVAEELTTIAKTDPRAMTDVMDDEFFDFMENNISDYITNEKRPEYVVTLSRFMLDRVMKPVAGSAGAGSDIEAKAESYWAVRLTDEGEWEHDEEAEARDAY